MPDPQLYTAREWLADDAERAEQLVTGELCAKVIIPGEYTRYTINGIPVRPETITRADALTPPDE
jgi:hypothetical protein